MIICIYIYKCLYIYIYVYIYIYILCFHHKCFIQVPQFLIADERQSFHLLLQPQDAVMLFYSQPWVSWAGKSHPWCHEPHDWVVRGGQHISKISWSEFAGRDGRHQTLQEQLPAWSKHPHRFGPRFKSPLLSQFTQCLFNALVLNNPLRRWTHTIRWALLSLLTSWSANFPLQLAPPLKLQADFGLITLGLGSCLVLSLDPP